MTHDSLSAGAVDGVIRYAYLANEIVFDRRFDAPLEKLWDFVAKPENLIKWMGGRLDKFEVEVGGKFEICIAPQWNAMIYGTVSVPVPARRTRVGDAAASDKAPGRSA